MPRPVLTVLPGGRAVVELPRETFTRLRTERQQLGPQVLGPVAASRRERSESLRTEAALVVIAACSAVVMCCSIVVAMRATDNAIAHVIRGISHAQSAPSASPL